MESKRRYSRFLPDDHEVGVQSSTGDRIIGQVVNESYGGLGVRCDDARLLQVGELVVVELEGGRHPARVVSLRPGDDGVHIGLQWLAEDDEPSFPQDLNDE